MPSRVLGNAFHPTTPEESSFPPNHTGHPFETQVPLPLSLSLSLSLSLKYWLWTYFLELAHGYLILIECMLFSGLAAAAGIFCNIASAPPSIKHCFSGLTHPTTYSPLGMALGCGRILKRSSPICQPSQSRRSSFSSGPPKNFSCDWDEYYYCYMVTSREGEFFSLFPCALLFDLPGWRRNSKDHYNYWLLVPVITKRENLKWSTENKEMLDFEPLQADNLLVRARKPTRL